VRAISREVFVTPQRLHAEHPRERMKIQSDPHGDMGRAAEMTAPPIERLRTAAIGGNRRA
jgi:hypothetical protein